ncbi:tetratricopeptide repeat protein [Sphingobacterium sp. DK4209]|uniref:Tetratricopeptide repeat protein n=1 Tax=Sphingobacterium zhuxiongii TaxID=2662364 RepID=A0A5Q0QAY4_9SPHI|nr:MULTISPECIES: tetratricopeptide repeat protein [unclassified Sphingobacterium]MVZ66440.1 tetratricopeptide repeat protein [Sphingobacterium sp. DK4209]QGA27287.1 tetratricopeptide repeat protein [Sphingobacterium sp. dk4302]
MEGRLTQLKAFLEESPNDPFLKYALTMEYVKLGNDEQALAGFEDLILVHEDYVGTYYHFGKFLEGKNQQDRAISIYEKGMQIAQQKRNFHALGELRNAHMAANGLLDEDE